MSIYNEIFGFEDKALPVQKTLPEPALECWRWQITPASGNADATCQKILDAAFTKQLLGDLPQPIALESELVIATPNAWAALSNLTGKLAKKWSSKKHRPAVQSIVDKIRNSPAFEASRYNVLWEALMEHATDYCCEAIHAEAAEEI